MHDLYSIDYIKDNDNKNKASILENEKVIIKKKNKKKIKNLNKNNKKGIKINNKFVLQGNINNENEPKQMNDDDGKEDTARETLIKTVAEQFSVEGRRDIIEKKCGQHIEECNELIKRYQNEITIKENSNDSNQWGYKYYRKKNIEELNKLIKTLEYKFKKATLEGDQEAIDYINDFTIINLNKKE